MLASMKMRRCGGNVSWCEDVVALVVAVAGSRSRVLRCHWDLEECARYLPTCGGCEAVLGVFYGQLRVVWGGVEWLNACVVGWWSVAIAGSAW